MTYSFKSPESEQEWRDYYQLRWQILRKPWQRPEGSERDELEDQAFHVIALDNTSTVIGAGRIHSLDENSAQIRYMAVAQEFQGQGVGSRLLEQLEATARNWQCQEIVLNARNSCLNFYTKHGYKIIGEAPTLFGSIAHTRLRKQLD